MAGTLRSLWKHSLMLPLLFLAGCAGYGMVSPGPVSLGAMSVEPVSAWNRSSAKVGGRVVWTQQGIYLDRLTFIDGIRDGKPLFAFGKREEFGLFRAAMLPNEVMELTESSLAKLHGSALVETHGLRPATFGDVPGFRFDYRYVSGMDVPMKGLAAGAIVEGRLYLILYEAPETHYFEAGLPEAEAIIQSVSLT